MRVSTINLVSMVIVLIATTIVPIGFLVLLGIKKKITFLPFLTGIGSFFVSQVILRLPLLSVLGTQVWFTNFTKNYFILYAILIGGLSAGLFEESGRLVGGKLLKQRTTLKDAISFGLGHGLCEVFFLFSITQISNIIYSLMINNGTIDNLAKLVPAEQLDYLINALTTLPTDHLYLGLLERAVAVTIHIVLSIIVFRGIRERKLSYYFVAILIHTILNAIFVIIYQYTNLYLAEAFIFLCTFALAYFIYDINKRQKARLQEQSSSSSAETTTTHSFDSLSENDNIIVS